MAVTASLRYQVFWRDNFSCRYCGAAPPDVLLHADHVWPRSEGGPDESWNLVPACQACNLTKSAKFPPNRVRELVRSADAVWSELDDDTKAALPHDWQRLVGIAFDYGISVNWRYAAGCFRDFLESVVARMAWPTAINEAACSWPDPILAKRCRWSFLVLLEQIAEDGEVEAEQDLLDVRREVSGTGLVHFSEILRMAMEAN